MTKNNFDYSFDYPLGENIDKKLIQYANSKRLNNLGSPSKLAFNYKDSDDIFKESNYQDPLILKIREFIQDSYINESHPELDIVNLSQEDQHTYAFTINKNDDFEKSHYIITWYKHRGRTEKFLQSDLTPIRLDALIEITEALFGKEFFKNNNWIQKL